MGKQNSLFSLKRVLVTLQFGISILLIGSAFIARDQVLFLIETKLGIEKEQVLATPGVPDGVRDEFRTFKDRLLNIPRVTGVTGCMEVPSREIRDAGPVLVQGINSDPEKAPIMDVQIMDHDFLDVLGIRLLAGENIPQILGFDAIPEFTETYTFQHYLEESRRAYLINESAMRQLGWDEPEEAIGQDISWTNGAFELAFGPVTGVVRDYHQETLKIQLIQQSWYLSLSGFVHF